MLRARQAAALRAPQAVTRRVADPVPLHPDSDPLPRTSAPATRR
ncbi:MAG: hypothetical protein ACTHN3_13125 [Solirubrobacterales bacterium]